MKLVINGFAGAGTISLGGFDYHDGTRATGETRNFKAGQMIGAVLEYAQRVGKPLMIYVFSDGSLNSNMHDRQQRRGRGKLGWQGDNSSRRVDVLPGVQPERAPAAASTAPPASRSATSPPPARR